ncbi:MAG: hypothetical protein FWD64_06290 [Acidobacteriaceae bacterium]|nr:hypothetical protein [Acidobacteriaceae bacterium]
MAGFAALLQGSRACASVAFLMEEPYGDFGAFNPTGHAAVYLDHVCADTPARLRLCHQGEHGTVISRYHKIAGYDWIAVPLVPYLYAVDSTDDIPAWVDRAKVAELRDAYRREYLAELAPDGADGKAPGGEWIQLIGSSYDRKIYGFQFETTAEQDQRLIAFLNDRKNASRFNLFFHNCADFARMVMNLYLPHSARRNFIADVGMTTPKQIARSLTRYRKRHPEVKMTIFVIPQVPGSVPRSHGVHGVAESLVRSKKYLIPLAALHPEVTGGIVVAYLIYGRFHPPKDAQIFVINNPEDSQPSFVAGPPALAGNRQIPGVEDTIRP